MQMAQHILITKAVRTTYRDKPDLPQSFTYDPVSGYWREGDRGAGTRAKIEAMTKKNDIETGEDMKGA